MCTSRTEFSRCRGRAPKSPPKPQWPIGWVRLPSPVDNNKYKLWTRIYGTYQQQNTTDFADYTSWHKEMLIYN